MGHTMINERLWRGPTEKDSAAAVAEFIRTKGVTRCPTACVLPTQGSVAATDREALEEYAMRRDHLRQAKAAARARQYWGVQVWRPADK
jgi:hypothetical protein